jgi:hypothetical protein
MLYEIRSDRIYHVIAGDLSCSGVSAQLFAPVLSKPVYARLQKNLLALLGFY